MMFARRPGLLAALAAVLVCTSFAVYAHMAAPVLPEDDAFITMRYADNAIRGLGIVYNEGEYVFGVSTPVYLGWLMVLRAVSSSDALPALAVRLNAVWFVAAAGALAWLIFALSKCRVAALAAACMMLLHPSLLDISTGAMEAFLFSALVLAALAAMASGQRRWAALAVGVAAVTRPEGLILGIIYAVWWAWRGRWDPLAAVLASSPLLAWCAFALYYYGSVIPHSVIAKAAPLYLTTRMENALVVLGVFVRAVLPVSLVESSPGVAVPVGLGILGVVAFVVLRRIVATRLAAAWPALALFAGLVVLYTQPGMVLFPWYEPVILLLGLALVFGVVSVSVGQAAIEGRAAGLVTGLAAGLLLVGGGPWFPGVGAVNPTPYRLRILAYAEAGRLLARMDPPVANAMASEIGALGYFFDGKVLDAAGLVSPGALPYLPVPLPLRPGPTAGAIPLGYVLDATPDAVVATSGYVDHTLEPSSAFALAYRLVARIPLPQPRPSGGVLRIYRRADALD